MPVAPDLAGRFRTLLVVLTLAGGASSCADGPGLVAPAPREQAPPSAPRLAVGAAGARLPMYELYRAASTDHFYTTNAAERDAAMASYGFAYQGIAFYVESSAATGAIGFQRFYRGYASTDHFYTIDQGEVGYVLSQGWQAEGIEGYVYATPPYGSTALYRLNWYPGDGQLDHAYTTDYGRVQALRAAGWTLDGVAGYVWTQPGVVASNDPLTVVVQGSTVRIRNTVTGIEHVYTNVIPCGTGVYAAEQYDLNGTPGFEIVIQAAGCSSQLIAIDDANQRVYSWQIPPGSRREFKFGETDPSHAGREILFLSNAGVLGQGATLWSVKLSATSSAVGMVSIAVPYSLSGLLGVTDFDGAAGDEIAIVSNYDLRYYRDASSGLGLIWMINLNSFSATFLPGVDTDGRAGAEVPVTRTYFGGGRSISIVDLARRVVRDYAQPWTIVSSTMRDLDGQPGAEICYYAGAMWRTIVDRTQSIGVGTYCAAGNGSGTTDR